MWNNLNDRGSPEMYTRLTGVMANDTSNDRFVSGLDTRLTSAESSVTSLQAQVTSNDSDISGIDTRLTSAESNITSNDSDISGLDTRLTSAEAEVNLARARSGGVWSQDVTTVYFSPSSHVIRQSYGAWAYDPVSSDMLFIAPLGGAGDRHFEYTSTGDLIFTGVA